MFDNEREARIERVAKARYVRDNQNPEWLEYSYTSRLRYEAGLRAWLEVIEVEVGGSVL